MPSKSIDITSEEEFESMVQLSAGDEGAAASHRDNDSPLPPPPPPPLASAPARAQCMLSAGRLLRSCLPSRSASMPSLSGSMPPSADPTNGTTPSPHLPPPPPPPPPFPPSGVRARRPKSAARSRPASDVVLLRKFLWEKVGTNQHSRSIESLSAAADCPVWWQRAVPHGVQADEASLLILFAVVQVI